MEEEESPRRGGRATDSDGTASRAQQPGKGFGSRPPSSGGGGGFGGFGGSGKGAPHLAACSRARAASVSGR
eukprot:scaffold6819_cov282-Prasinococcus_capsulatus_cf.AAC.1